MKTPKAYTLIELLITLAILSILAALVAGVVGGCTRSSGARVGTISKFSLTGNFHKSYEGEMIVGGLRIESGRNSSSAVANVWSFTVTDPEVVKQVEAAQDSGHRVKALYRQSTTHNPFAQDTSYIVYKIIDLDAPIKAEQDQSEHR